MSHNYLNKNRTQELIKTIRGHLSDIATVLSNLASGDARDNTKAPINHTQPSSTINAMTGYSKPQATSAITASDTLNGAIGKLEAAIDTGGETIPPIVVNRLSNTSTTSSASGNITVINFDPDLFKSHPIKFKIRAGYISTSNNVTSVSSTQDLNVEMGIHGKNLITTSGNNELSYSSEGYYAMSGGFMYGQVQTSSVASVTARQLSTPMLVLSNAPSNSWMIYRNNSFQFYAQWQTSGGTYYKTYIDYIQPIDFTAVTSVTHGGVTVWERT